jgi:hypothetical protein
MSGRRFGDRSPAEYLGVEEIGDSPVERKLT